MLLVQDIAPFAVLSSYDSLAQRFLPPAPWKDFKALAGSALIPDGLHGPAVCKPIFDLNMAAVDNPKAAKQQLQQYLSTMDLFKGRYRAMPLPPIHTTIPAIEEVTIPPGREIMTKAFCKARERQLKPEAESRLTTSCQSSLEGVI